VAALASAWRRRLGGEQAGLVLLYHRVDRRPGDLERELVPAVARDAFAAQLAWVARHYRPVDAREILDAVRGRRRLDRFPVAITFDDDSPTYLRDAVPALRKEGLRATFFVCGASLEKPFAFWWERLQAAADAGLPIGQVLPGENLHAVGAAVERMKPDERDAVAAALEELGARPRDVGLDAPGLAALAREHDIGWHTLRHHPVSGLDDERLRAAMHNGRDEVERIAGAPLEAIAYPHGAAGPREALAARAAGLRLGFVTRPVACTPDTDPLLIGRAEIGHAPLGVFAVRLERALGRRA
jgi:peptidoglycan/xylan/chitin deacetylase (PgdA/CDA1 family)